jgi:DNA mismatch repair ATPase MutS
LVGYDAGAFAAYVQVTEEKAHSLICTLKKTPQLLDLEAQVAQSERAVLEAQQALLAALSAQLRSVIAGLRAGIRWLALCDAHLRTLGFTASYEYCIPVIRSERIFEVTAARFLPLLELFDEDVMGPYTPLSLGAAPACTIVGSNMGGKSTAVLTCAFVALLVQRGLPVPAQAAQICLIDRLFVLAGGGEPRPYISHFGEEMLLLQSALSAGEGRALVILDEFCRTTGVGEGRALLAAIIAAFVQRENLVIAATHFDGLPQLLSLPQYRVGGLDGAVMYAAQASLPERMRALTMHLDRRLTPDNGEHRSSDAFRIAAALGVDQDVLANAQEMYHVG